MFGGPLDGSRIELPQWASTYESIKRLDVKDMLTMQPCVRVDIYGEVKAGRFIHLKSEKRAA